MTVEDNTDSDDEYLFVIGSNMEHNTVQITVEGTLILVIVDSGASVNVLDSATLTDCRNPELYSEIPVSKFTRTARKHPSLSKEFLTQMCQPLNFRHRPTLLLMKIYMWDRF